MKLETVNVVEIASDSLVGVQSFSKDEAGIKEAEDTFKSVITENGDNVTDEEMTGFVTDGYFEQGDYQLFLVGQ